MERKRKLTETFCVVRRNDGTEDWFLSVKSAAAACGFSADAVERSAGSGRELKVAGCPGMFVTFRVVPARYRVVVRRTGQELICRYDAADKVFRSDRDGVIVKKTSVSEYEEVHDGSV